MFILRITWADGGVSQRRYCDEDQARHDYARALRGNRADIDVISLWLVQDDQFLSRLLGWINPIMVKHIAAEVPQEAAAS